MPSQQTADYFRHYLTPTLLSYDSQMEKGLGRFGAIGVGVIVLGVSLWVYRSYTPSGWTEFSSPDGDFSVLLPSRPEIETYDAVSESGKAPTPVHWLTSEDATSTFICMYWDLAYTPADETDAQMSMAGTRDGLINKLGGHLLTHEYLQPSGDRPGYSEQRYTATTTDNGIMEGKSFIVGHRMYLLSVSYPAESRNENADKFFQSFHRPAK